MNRINRSLESLAFRLEQRAKQRRRRLARTKEYAAERAEEKRKKEEKFGPEAQLEAQRRANITRLKSAGIVLKFH